MLKQKTNETCTWAIHNFPRKLKNRYAAFLKANDTTIHDHMVYMVAKTLRDAGGDIPEFVFQDLIERFNKRIKI